MFQIQTKIVELDRFVLVFYEACIRMSKKKPGGWTLQMSILCLNHEDHNLTSVELHFLDVPCLQDLSKDRVQLACKSYACVVFKSFPSFFVDRRTLFKCDVQARIGTIIIACVEGVVVCVCITTGGCMYLPV